MARVTHLFVLATLATFGCSAAVGSGLDDAEAERMLAALQGAGLAATKEADPRARGSYLVEVPVGDTAEALRALLHQGSLLPLGDEHEPLPARPLLPGLSEQRAGYLARVARELETSLESVSGVANARVHLTAKQPAALSPREIASQAAASVLLQHTSEQPPLSRDEIARLVAGAVSELEPQAVSVVVRRVVRAPAGPQPLVQLGPVSLTQNTAPIARALVFGSLVLFVVTALVLLGLWLRLRKFVKHQ